MHSMVCTGSEKTLTWLLSLSLTDIKNHNTLTWRNIHSNHEEVLRLQLPQVWPFLKDLATSNGPGPSFSCIGTCFSDLNISCLFSNSCLLVTVESLYSNFMLILTRHAPLHGSTFSSSKTLKTLTSSTFAIYVLIEKQTHIFFIPNIFINDPSRPYLTLHYFFGLSYVILGWKRFGSVTLGLLFAHIYILKSMSATMSMAF